MNHKILIVDDEEDIARLIQGLLEDEGYITCTASNSDGAYRAVLEEKPDLIVQDIWLQGSKDDGIDVLKKVRLERENLPFIMISGHGTIETAVSAIKLGAYDFIEKPFKSDRLLLMIQRALEYADLKRRNSALKKQAASNVRNFSGRIPDSLQPIIDKVSQTNSRVLITGEAGCEKNDVAQYIHNKSPRLDKPFMTLNCASQDLNRLETELFGVRGGHTGLLEMVDGGTLFLDEVAGLPIEIQGKILNLLQVNTYHKVGSNEKEVADIRVIASSSTDIQDKMSSGEFRADLYYRLNVVSLHMPSLGERRQEIPTLIKSWQKEKDVSGVSSFKFSDEAVILLQSYSWPGNIRQFHNVMEWVYIMHISEKTILAKHLPSEISGIENKKAASNDKIAPFNMLQMGLREARECFERHYLLSQVNRFDGNISKTSEFIGMERSALHRKLKSLEVFSDEKQNVA